MLDIAATIYEIVGVEYPMQYNEETLPRLDGESFLRVLTNNNAARQHPLFWEHQGNRAVRQGRWKLVNRHGDEWELFDMENDRTEMNDLAKSNKDRVDLMIRMWRKWADRCEVHSWPLHAIEEGGRDWAHLPWLW